MSGHFAFMDVNPELVNDDNARLLVRLVVADLDRQCPDPQLRQFAQWRSTLWQTPERFVQGLLPVFRVSVHWPQLEATQ